MGVAGSRSHLGSYEEAVGGFAGDQSNRNYPPAYFNLAAALAQLGRLDEAHSAVKAGLALDPTFAVSRARASWTAMSDNPTYLASIEPFSKACAKPESPNDRDPPPRGQGRVQ